MFWLNGDKNKRSGRFFWMVKDRVVYYSIAVKVAKSTHKKIFT